MKLIRLAGDGCAGDNCPTVYLGDTGELVIQGHIIDDATRSELHAMPADENAIRIRPELLISAVEQYLSHPRAEQ
ncbi:hypothetical protein ABGB17_05450 [Sphaerisporangium sp. B11E5]|uniref:hypothetical protein n=1 Tax=Sphaerisporangium sp. B11E5 TaxID=3153563 RepID=UPI00325F49E0